MKKKNLKKEKQKSLSLETRMKIKTYPSHYQAVLYEVAKEGG